MTISDFKGTIIVDFRHKAVARISPGEGPNQENGMASEASRIFFQYFVVNVVKIEQKEQKCNGEQEKNR